MIPGKQVGWLKIDADARAVFENLGKPDWGDAAMGKALSVWTLEDSLTQKVYQLRLFTTTKMGVENFSRIRYIRMTSSQYRLASGLGVGSSLQAIEKTFALKDSLRFTMMGQKYTLRDTRTGIAFEFDAAGKCQGFLVYPSDETAQSSYIPMYEDRFTTH